jgi:hypothetical protein
MGEYRTARRARDSHVARPAPKPGFSAPPSAPHVPTKADRQATFRAAVAQRAATAGAGVVQLRWIYVDGSGIPGQYYWEGRGAPQNAPPGGGIAIPAPDLQSMEDTHRGGGHGSMRSLRTEEAVPETGLNFLSHAALLASSGLGSFYGGPLEPRGIGPTPVQSTIPRRNPSEHATIFRQMTGDTRSATDHQQHVGTAVPGLRYEITHGMGHGEGGAQTQHPNNLASASRGANSQMILPDNAISGNPAFSVDTRLMVQPGTHVAHQIEQNFYHRDLPGIPIFSQTIDAQRPEMTRDEWNLQQQQVGYLEDETMTDAVIGMLQLPRQPGPGNNNNNNGY